MCRQMNVFFFVSLLLASNTSRASIYAPSSLAVAIAGIRPVRPLTLQPFAPGFINLAYDHRPGYLKAIWLENVGSVFRDLSAKLDPGTLLIGSGSKNGVQITPKQPRRPILSLRRKGVSKRFLYYSGPTKGFLYYSGPTKEISWQGDGLGRTRLGSRAHTLPRCILPGTNQAHVEGPER